MEVELIARLDDYFVDNPIVRGKPCTIREIEDAEAALNLKFNDDYKTFILKFGGCYLGSKQVYAFSNCELLGDLTVIDLTEQYRDGEGAYFNWLIIGFDLAGNSIGMNELGKIALYDHDFGEMVILAESFEEYLIRGLTE